MVKIRIAKTGSSGSRGFKINTRSTATGTPLVERHEVANKSVVKFFQKEPVFVAGLKKIFTHKTSGVFFTIDNHFISFSISRSRQS